MLRPLARTVALALLTGCAAAPGVYMEESRVADRGAGEGEGQVKVEDITPAVVRRQLEARAKARAPRPDPLGGLAVPEYRIAPYDVLQVTVWDHPELTIPAGEFRSPEATGNPVGADGTMFYPHVGVVPVAGKTVSEVRRFLTEKLARVVQNPQLDVRVAAFRGKRVQVTGEVLAPSTLALTDVPLRVQDAIALAKGPTPEADLSRVTLTRAGATHLLDLQALYERGDLSQNWLLQEGDVLHVADRSRNVVFVLGEVRRPATKVMNKARMTLAEALGAAEGFDQTAANGKVYVLRGDLERPQVFKLDASSADALLLATQFPLDPADVVYVASANISRWNRVMSQILPTVQTLWQMVDITYRTRLLTQ